MRGLRSGLVTMSVAGIFGVGVVVGCSANGNSDPVVDDTMPTDPTMMPPAKLPPAGSSTSSKPMDAGKPVKDAGKDSTVDAGPPPPVPGTACPTLDELRNKPCGACGTQETLCLGNGDGGAGVWSAYGACQNELVGGCIPGTVVKEACGNCGTSTKTCSKYCGFSITACAGQPPMSCVPGAVDLSNAGCALDSYHQRTCASSCTYSNFGVTCDAAPTTIEVGPTIGSLTSTIVTLTSTQTTTKLADFCPTATLSAATVKTPYAYLKVHNPNTTPITVAIYNSVAPGGVIFPTLLASYGAATPTTDVQRKACIHGVNDFGDDTLTGDFSFASLSDADAVTIAPNDTATIYNAAQDVYSAANPTDSTGKVKLNVLVTQVN